MSDLISHYHFDPDAEVVYSVCTDHIGQLAEEVRGMPIARVLFKQPVPSFAALKDEWRQSGIGDNDCSQHAKGVRTSPAETYRWMGIHQCRFSA